MMQFLTGETGGKNVARLERHRWGRVRIARDWMPYAGEPWALDNGAWRQFAAVGQPWDDPYSVRYDWTEWARHLTRYRAGDYGKGHPLFIVAPDVVGGGLGSIADSLDAVHEHCGDVADWWAGWNMFEPMALVVSDGIKPADIVGDECHICGDETWRHFSWIFLGGSQAYKARTVRDWRTWCDEYALRLHYGRCSTMPRIRLASDVGCDSADSAAIMWTYERWRAAELEVAALPQSDLFTTQG